MGIKAIETIYSGYRFRSRLEARWAVFFDVLNIHYEYEPQGYDLGKISQTMYVDSEEDINLGRYLPDFWLPQVQMWAEVKASTFTPIEHKKCEVLAKASGYPCLMLDGPPAARNYWAYECGYGAEGEPEFLDYVLIEGHCYWETENRFYSSTGTADWQILNLDNWADGGIGEKGILAARQARFEHGETPR